MSGIYLVAALAVAFALPVQAQQLNQSKIYKLHNNATGEPLGTVTYSNGRAYIRDKDGVHISTVVRNPDGSTTTLDPNGNIVAPTKPTND